MATTRAIPDTARPGAVSAFRTNPPARALGITAAATTAAWTLAWSHEPALAEEHHAMEWAQVVFLVLALALFSRRMAGHASPSVPRMVWFGLVTFCFTLLIRELAIGGSGLPGAAVLEEALRVLAGAGWVAVGIWVLVTFREVRRGFRAVVFGPTGLLIAAGFGGYLATWVFEMLHLDLPAATALFLEELVEFHATFLIFCAALVSRRLSIPDAPPAPAG